jgi:hypothetical protein
MPTIPQRSVLFNLAPIGIGTRSVESLDGYLTRLSRRHDSPLRVLKSFILYGANPGRGSVHPAALAQRADGPSAVSQRLSSKLPGLTLQRQTGSMGFGKLNRILSPNHAFRTHRAWCPCCINDMRTGEVYQPMAWTLEEYSHCTIHRCELVDACPTCDFQVGYRQDWLPSEGKCPRCDGTLGAGCDSRHTNTQRSFSPAEIFSACLADFCESLSQCSVNENGGTENEPPDAIEKTIRHVLSTKTVSSDQELAQLIGLTPLFLQRMMSDDHAMPTLATLARLSLLSGVPVAGIFDKSKWHVAGPTLSVDQLCQLPSAHNSQRRDYKQMQTTAQELIDRDDGRPTEQIAAEFGVSVQTMRLALGRQLMAGLVASAKRKRKAAEVAEFGELVEQIAQTCKRLQTRGDDVSAAKVGREIGRLGEGLRFMKAFEAGSRRSVEEA